MRALVGTVIAVAAMPATAGATMVRVTEGGCGDDVPCGPVAVEIADGDGNAADIVADEATVPGTVVVTDAASAVAAGPGCVAVDAQKATCKVPHTFDVRVFGDDGDDHLQLVAAINSGSEVLDGGAGDDTLVVTGPSDATLIGEEGDDTLIGGDAGAGPLWQVGEALFGGPGNDVVQGNGGNDQLQGGPGLDRLDAGSGDDHIDAREKDLGNEPLAPQADALIACGDGNDETLIDPLDQVAADCEANAVEATIAKVQPVEPLEPTTTMPEPTPPKRQEAVLAARARVYAPWSIGCVGLESKGMQVGVRATAALRRRHVSDIRITLTAISRVSEPRLAQTTVHLNKRTSGWRREKLRVKRGHCQVIEPGGAVKVTFRAIARGRTVATKSFKIAVPPPVGFTDVVGG